MGTRAKLGVVFLAGLFLIGIGGGVAFAEFGSFKLGEEKVIGADSMETATFKEKIPDQEGTVYLCQYGNRNQIDVVTDASLGQDDIVFEIEYNRNAVENNIRADGEDNYFYFNYHYKDFYMFNYMDDILNSIKDKKIPNYQIKYFGRQTVRIAPENEPRIKIVK